MRMGPDLLVTLQGDLDDRTVESIEREITDQVARIGARAALIDVSGLAVLDSFVDKHEPVRPAMTIAVDPPRNDRAARTEVTIGGESDLLEVRSALRSAAQRTGLGLTATTKLITVGSLGLGLPGSRRLVDEFTIDSAPGRGTTVVINQWER